MFSAGFPNLADDNVFVIGKGDNLVHISRKRAMEPTIVYAHVLTVINCG